MSRLHNEKERRPTKMATKRRRDDSSSSSSETSSSSSSSETSSSSSETSSSSSSRRRRRRRNKKSRTTTTTTTTTRKEKRRKREERDGDDDVEGLETNAKLLDARKKLLKKIRDFERAHERAKDISTSRAQEKKTKTKSRSGRHHHHHHRREEEEEEENARPHQREYDGPMDRERAAMMMPATNEWTREKEERAREKVEKKVFAPPPAPKRRKVGENAKDEDAEEGEVKKEQKKFVPPPGEMTMKAAPYVPPPKQKAAKTWKRPPVVPNRNKVEGPKIPEIGKSGFTRQRSVSPGIHAKDLAPWTMSAHAKKPTTEEEEEEEEAVKEKPKNVPPAAPARTRATRSASPSPVLPKPIPPAPESRRRSSRRSKSVSVEPVDPSTLGEKKEQRPPTRQKAAAAAAAASAALTVRELKDILAKKGLRTDGLKADLVERVASLEEKN